MKTYSLVTKVVSYDVEHPREQTVRYVGMLCRGTHGQPLLLEQKYSIPNHCPNTNNRTEETSAQRSFDLCFWNKNTQKRSFFGKKKLLGKNAAALAAMLITARKSTPITAREPLAQR